MSYEMQIRSYYTGPQVSRARVSWKSLKAALGFNDEPYRWEHEERAQKMLDLSYPDLPDEHKRVIEVKKKVNIGNEEDSRGKGGFTLPMFGWERKKK